MNQPVPPRGAPRPSAAPAAAHPKPAATAEQPTPSQPMVRPGAIQSALLAAVKADPGKSAEAARLQALWSVYRSEPEALSWGNKLGVASASRMILFCLANELDPTSSDVYILGDSPYVSFDGRTKVAFRSGKFEGYAIDRCLKPSEYEEYGLLDRSDDQRIAVAWIAHAVRKDCKFPFVGIGVAYENEMGPKGPQPVARQNPREMAQKRARHRALRAAFPIDIYAPEEIDGEVYEVRTAPEGGLPEMNPDHVPPAQTVPPVNDGPSGSHSGEAPVEPTEEEQREIDAGLEGTREPGQDDDQDSQGDQPFDRSGGVKRLTKLMLAHAEVAERVLGKARRPVAQMTDSQIADAIAAIEGELGGKQ